MPRGERRIFFHSLWVDFSARPLCPSKKCTRTFQYTTPVGFPSSAFSTIAFGLLQNCMSSDTLFSPSMIAVWNCSIFLYQTSTLCAKNKVCAQYISLKVGWLLKFILVEIDSYWVCILEVTLIEEIICTINTEPNRNMSRNGCHCNFQVDGDSKTIFISSFNWLKGTIYRDDSCLHQCGALSGRYVAPDCDLPQFWYWTV